MTLWTKFRLFFTRGFVSQDEGTKSGDYTVKQYWKILDGKYYLIREVFEVEP